MNIKTPSLALKTIRKLINHYQPSHQGTNHHLTIYIITSPLQLIGAVEHKLQNPNETHLLLVITPETQNKKNSTQIKQTIDFFDWKEHNIFSCTGKSMKSRLARLSILLSISLNLRKINTICLGDSRAKWLKPLTLIAYCQKLIHLDDGTATLNKRKPKHLPCIHPSPKVFTFFNLDPTSFTQTHKHDFSLIRSFFVNEKPNDSSVYYFGSPYSEKDIIDLQTELNLLEFAASYLGSEAIYFAHRDESSEKLQIIQNKGLFNVFRPEIPAELFFLRKNTKPAVIAGAYTTTLFTLPLLLKPIKAYSFYIPQNSINKKHRINVKSIYKHLEKQNECTIIYTNSPTNK